MQSVKHVVEGHRECFVRSACLILTLISMTISSVNAVAAGQHKLLQVEGQAEQSLPVIDAIAQLAKLTASDGAIGDQFGRSVSISGDVVVAGAPGASVSGNATQGAAYVFVKPPNGWQDTTQTAKLTASDGMFGDALGLSVTVEGDVIIAGAPAAKLGRGAAYVFVKPAGGWKDMTETAELVASDGAEGDSFASSISLSRGTVVAGAPGTTVGRNLHQGSAYVFRRPGSGWASAGSFPLREAAKLIASDGAAESYFGSTSISGDTIGVGAAAANQGEGEAYVYVKPASGWTDMTETAQLKPSDASRALGSSIAVNGETVAAGAPGLSIDGKVYLFVKPADGWSNTTEIAQLQSQANNNWDFGSAVAISSRAVVVGAATGNGEHSGTGEGFVFVEPGSGWQTTSHYAYRFFALDGERSEEFGLSLAVSAQTAVVGAPFAFRDQRGAAYVFARK